MGVAKVDREELKTKKVKAKGTLKPVQKTKHRISDFRVMQKNQGWNQRFQCFVKKQRPGISDFRVMQKNQG